jgi:hypothetical protein
MSRISIVAMVAAAVGLSCLAPTAASAKGVFSFPNGPVRSAFTTNPIRAYPTSPVRVYPNGPVRVYPQNPVYPNDPVRGAFPQNPVRGFPQGPIRAYPVSPIYPSGPI